MKKEKIMYMVAKSDWHAFQLLKRIYKRKAPLQLLLETEQQAHNKIRTIPFGRQELYRVFKIKFDEIKFDKGI